MVEGDAMQETNVEPSGELEAIAKFPIRVEELALSSLVSHVLFERLHPLGKRLFEEVLKPTVPVMELFVNNSDASAEVVPPSIRKTARKAAVNFSGLFNILNYNTRFLTHIFYRFITTLPFHFLM